MSVARTFAAFVVALTLTGAAHGDIYTWVDGEGRTHASNLPPPDHVAAKAIKVARSQPRSEAELQREVDALAERLRRLEHDLQQAAALSVPPVPPMPVVQVPQYVPVPFAVPAPAPYLPIVEREFEPPCNPTWAGCYGSWGFAPIPTIVVVQSVPRRHLPRTRPPFASPPIAKPPIAKPPIAKPPLVRPLSG
jgi:hypothetical protein